MVCSFEIGKNLLMMMIPITPQDSIKPAGLVHRGSCQIYNPLWRMCQEGEHSEPDRSKAERQRGRRAQPTEPNWMTKQDSKRWLN